MSLLQEHYENRTVEMIIEGRRALVPMLHAAKIAKKQILVCKARQLQRFMAATPDIDLPITQKELENVMGKIIRLNRRIPACVKFIFDINELSSLSRKPGSRLMKNN